MITYSHQESTCGDYTSIKEEKSRPEFIELSINLWQSSCSLSFAGDVVRPSAGGQTCPTLHLVLYSINNWLFELTYEMLSTLSCMSVWTSELALTTVHRRNVDNAYTPRSTYKLSNQTFKHFLAQKSSCHDLFDCRSAKNDRWRWRTNFDVPLDNL